MNLEEWRIFLGKNFSLDETKQLIYKKNLSWYQNTLSIGESPILKSLSKSKRKGFLDYMLLAKQCENISSDRGGRSGWYQGEGQNQKNNKPALLEKALLLYETETNTFLKSRYGYQIVRLFHYLQQNEKAVAFFDFNMKLTRNSSYIWHRALEERSGVAYNLKDYNKATEGYLRVYQELPDRRRSCALSLRYLLWNEITLYQDTIEVDGFRDVLYFFNAYYGGAVDREMRKLQKEYPNSDYLQLLAIREADKIQRQLFSNDVGFSTDIDTKSSISDELYEIASNQLQNNDVKNKDIWKLIVAVGLMDNKKFKEAEEVLNSFKKDNTYYTSSKRLLFANEVLQITNVNRTEIERLYEELKEDEILHTYNPVSAFFFNHISDVYEKQGNRLIAHFGKYNYYGSNNDEKKNWESVIGNIGNHFPLEYHKYEYLDESIIERFNDFVYIEDKTSYEKFILSKVKEKPEDYLHELRGTYFLTTNQLDDAIIEFKQIENPNTFYEKLVRADLFSGAINEYFDTPFSQQSDKMHEKYPSVFDEIAYRGDVFNEDYVDNKLLLAQKLLELEGLVIKDHKNASDYYYMLGNAWYNMSERGWFLNPLHYISNSSRNKILGYDHNTENSNILFLAQSYFERSIDATVGNKETRAKATFMLAKIEMCFDAKWNNGTYTIILCDTHRGYFEKLHNEFSDTQFEKQIIKECSWYREFLN